MIVAQRELAGGRQEIVAVDTHVGVTDVLARLYVIGSALSDAAIASHASLGLAAA